jgi:hypothetical protein
VGRSWEKIRILNTGLEGEGLHTVQGGVYQIQVWILLDNGAGRNIA